MAISVLLVDDHGVVREAFRHLLETGDDFVVLAEASNGDEAYHKVQQFSPDITLLDLSLPGESGLSTLNRLYARDPDVRVLVLSMYDEAGFVLRAMESGARGYLSKSVSYPELKQALRAIYHGERYIEARLREHLLPGSGGKNPVHDLTSREFEVFRMLAAGASVNGIAEKLHLSAKTVGAHRTSLMKKLQLSNSAELVRVAVAWGVIKL